MPVQSWHMVSITSKTWRTLRRPTREKPAVSVEKPLKPRLPTTWKRIVPEPSSLLSTCMAGSEVLSKKSIFPTARRMILRFVIT